LYHDEIHGDLFSQVSKTIDLLLTKYLKAGISYQGIQRIFEACKNAGAPQPLIRYQGHDLWFEFPYSDEYLKEITHTKPEKTTPKTTQEKLLTMLKQNPKVSRDEMAKSLGITNDGVKYHLNRLRAQNTIRHVGPSRGGYWEILHQAS